MNDSVSDHTKRLRAALAARLERVRGNMSDADFTRLVADITRTAQRFEEIEARERSAPTPLPGTLPAIGRQPQTRPT
ncbi:MAG TPA: hypothetical protein VM076_01000 [Gemmatimonadaceae bacterium]|nr:hypothetical protein [Gemmatimonadaceae bacterium]